MLRIGYFYPKELNLYGDTGNIEVLTVRAQDRNIGVEVFPIDVNTTLNSQFMESLNVIFMGGGPDAQQKTVYQDLLNVKGAYIKEYIQKDGVGLFICGSYQLLGNYYKSSDGTVLQGLEIFDMYTEHFGNKKPRCIGNISCTINSNLQHTQLKNRELHGFENHGGRTYLGKNTQPLATVISGHGNNSEDKTEGALYKNAIGTYLHGPVLARNPDLADYIIAKALDLSELTASNF